jgi:hypothetical protein
MFKRKLKAIANLTSKVFLTPRHQRQARRGDFMSGFSTISSIVLLLAVIALPCLIFRRWYKEFMAWKQQPKSETLATPRKIPRIINHKISATLLIASLIIGVWVVGKYSPPTTSTPSDGLDKGKQIAWIDMSQGAIKSRLKDPDSAQFRNVYFTDASGGPMVCGEVNSKNSYGGYVGFQRFVASGDTLAFLEKEVKDFHKIWVKFCQK